MQESLGLEAANAKRQINEDMILKGFAGALLESCINYRGYPKTLRNTITHAKVAISA